MSGLTLVLAPGPATDAGRAIVRLGPRSMAAADLRPGDVVSLKGSRTTRARILPLSEQEDVARTDEVTAANAGALWGDSVELQKADNPELRSVRMKSTSSASASSIAPALQDMCLSPGDRHILLLEQSADQGSPGSIEVLVEETDPPKAGRVTPRTKIQLEAPRKHLPDYPGIAGLEKQIAALHEVVELPLERPELFDRIGLSPPRGVLFTGPPGSGKTLLAKALAERTEATFLDIAGPEIVSKHYGETERALREVFEEAARRAPSVIFIDEIDAIAPRRDALSGEKQVERRTVGQLLTLLDGLGARDRIVVIAATNLPDSLDPALRRPGRFEREITFSAPDVTARQQILSLHLANSPLASNVDVQGIARRTSGYLGADLAALAREGGLAALARARDAAGSTEEIETDQIYLTQEDLETALLNTRPSLLRADAFDEAPPGWKDVGGQAAVKAALTEAVIWPLHHRGAFDALGLTPPRGILLSGPPGTGKTLIARALASEAEMNFIPVQSSKLLSQYFGEAERSIEALFRRARLVAPALLFFDEIDALSPPRGTADPTTDRVVAQLLTEIDGMHRNADITIIAATNRPDQIDPALLRAGRFDMRVSMELPDAAGRSEILAIHTKTRALERAVDLVAIAQQTTDATPAELASIVADAARKALVRWRCEGKNSTPAISQKDLVDALQSSREQRKGSIPSQEGQAHPAAALASMAPP